MGLVKEEHELGLVQIPYLGQGLEQGAEHPQQEHGVDGGAVYKLGGVQDVHIATAVLVAGEPILQVKVGLAEEDVAALVFHGNEGAQDCAHGLAAHAAVGSFDFLGMLRHVVEHGPQILQIDQQQALVIGNAKHYVQHALLHFRELQQTGKQRGPHVGNGHTHRNAVPFQHGPEAAGRPFVAPALDAELLDAGLHLFVVGAGLAHTPHVALHVGHEHGHACLGKALCNDLQRYGLARTGRTGDQTMAIRLVQQQIAGVLTLGNPDLVFKQHGRSFPENVAACACAHVGSVYRVRLPKTGQS